MLWTRNVHRARLDRPFLASPGLIKVLEKIKRGCVCALNVCSWFDYKLHPGSYERTFVPQRGLVSLPYTHTHNDNGWSSTIDWLTDVSVRSEVEHLTHDVGSDRWLFAPKHTLLLLLLKPVRPYGLGHIIIIIIDGRDAIGIAAHAAQ